MTFLPCRRQEQCLELLDECRKVSLEVQTVELHTLGAVQQATIAYRDLLEGFELGELIM
jgi:hypothetical protein